jgi:hypothetical protein
MHLLRDVFRNSERSVASLVPCFLVYKLQHSGLVDEYPPDSALAEKPQLR